MGESPLEYVEQIEKLCRRLREALGAEPVLFESPPSANPLTEAEIDRQWADMQAMGSAFGAKWQTNLGPARRHLVKRTLRDHPGPHTLIKALRGFLRLSADWTPGVQQKALVPEYVLRPTKIEGHLEAGQNPFLSGNPSGDYQSGPDVPGLSVEADSLRETGSFGQVGQKRG